MKVTGKVFIVTGGGSGIGKALVKELHTRGARVAAVDISKENLSALTNEFEGTDTISTHSFDITDKKAVENLPKQVIDIHGHVDGVINNAGIIQPFVPIDELSYDTITKVFDVNFYGSLYMTKSLLPTLKTRPEAHIVNVSSMGGFLPVPGQSIYGASKAAVKLMSEGLYAELKDTSIHVSVVFPGATETNITKNSGVKTPEVSEDTAKKFPALSATKAAKIIIDGVEKNNLRIYTGKDSKMMNRLYRLAPTFATNFIAKQMKSLLTPAKR